jgi:hypothetical protein
VSSFFFPVVTDNPIFLRAYMAAVLSGDSTMDNTDFPTFMFDHKVVYDPDKPEEGFGRGYLVVRVSVCANIFFNIISCVFNRLPDTYILEVARCGRANALLPRCPKPVYII